MIVVDMNQGNEWGFCCVRVKGVRTLINLLAFVEIHNPRTDPNGTKLSMPWNHSFEWMCH